MKKRALLAVAVLSVLFYSQPIFAQSVSPGTCEYWQGTWAITYSSGIDNITIIDVCVNPGAGQVGNTPPACMSGMFSTCEAKGKRASDNQSIMIGQLYMDQRIYAYYETWTPGGTTPYDAVYYRDPADNASFVANPFNYTGGYWPMIPGRINDCDFVAALDGSFTIYSSTYPAGAPYTNTFGLVSGARLTPECINSTSTTTTIKATTTTTSVEPTTTTTSVEQTTTTTTTVSGRPCPAKKALGEDNPNLDTLRAFRDSRLANSAVGRKIIQIYYTNADSIDAALERSPALRDVTRRVLEVIAPMVGK